jgi:pilus assembly protein Flp/PilA
MQNLVLKMYIARQALKRALQEEKGQDMVEYALVMGLIALGATASMQGLAGTIAQVFTNIGSNLTTYTT